MSHERDDVPFYEVTHAVADAEGIVYCAGTVPTQEETNSFYGALDGPRRHFENAIWTYDSALRPGPWRREGGAIGRLAILEPGWITVFADVGVSFEPFVLATKDASPGDGPPRELRGSERVLRDVDGSYVVVAKGEDELPRVARVAPAEGWKRVPLFRPSGFLARMLSSDELALDWGGCAVLASDGDLVVHSANSRTTRIRRFDRSGRCLVQAPSPLGGFAQEATLVAGRDGIVWAWGGRKLCAVTRSAVNAHVLTPGMEEGLGPALVALGDSLVLFGDDGRIARARTSGAKIVSFEIVS